MKGLNTMKAIHFENLSEALRELMQAAAEELDRVEEACDDAAEACAAADKAEDWDACDKYDAEYKRRKYNIADLEAAIKALHDAANAFEGLEVDGQDVLRNMGLV
jgi:hypothetical protein